MRYLEDQFQGHLCGEHPAAPTGRPAQRPLLGQGRIGPSRLVPLGLVGDDTSRRALRESIRIHNENKRLLKELYDIKRENPASLTNKEMFSLIKLSMQVDKKEMNETLKYQGLFEDP